MPIAFHSSHVTGDFSAGELAIDIITDEDATGASRHDRVHFSVSRDFYVHNDCVAAALMTLVGRTSPVVTFNFPISQYCAGLMSAYYTLQQVGPVDPNLEPRRPGRHLAINFSGGLDSTGLYLLLREVLGDAFKVVTSDFGKQFPLERLGFEPFRRDITCRTDLRERGYDRMGRFLAAVPLLHADYLDLGSVASGHTLMQESTTIARRHIDPASELRVKDAVYLAGGLNEEHLVRGLISVGILKLILDLAPERMETAFTASAARYTEKYFSRAIWAFWLYRQAGIPLPRFLQAAETPSLRRGHHPGQRYSLSTAWAVKYEGMETARRLNPRVDEFDFSYLADLSLLFMARYNTMATQLLPCDLSPSILAAFHRHDIFPYAERDWRELEVLRNEMFVDGAV